MLKVLIQEGLEIVRMKITQTRTSLLDVR